MLRQLVIEKLGNVRAVPSLDDESMLGNLWVEDVCFLSRSRAWKVLQDDGLLTQISASHVVDSEEVDNGPTGNRTKKTKNILRKKLKTNDTRVCFWSLYVLFLFRISLTWRTKPHIPYRAGEENSSAGKGLLTCVSHPTWSTAQSAWSHIQSV